MQDVDAGARTWCRQVSMKDINSAYMYGREHGKVLLQRCRNQDNRGGIDKRWIMATAG